MEILGERPAWSMTDSEKLSRLDASVAELARQKTYYLQLIADLDASGYANDIGAGDTARLLSTRYRIDPAEARRDVRLARALSKYDAVTAALPDPAAPSDAKAAARPMDPAQAAVIVAELERAPADTPPENLAVAEQQLVNLARTFTPAELRRAGHRIRAILDPDGPEPDENRAYKRESLTLNPADNGVTFRGYLANDNAELLRTLIHAGAKPHKTLDGAPDPRPRDKRQADALATLLTTAATVTNTPPPPNTRPTMPPRSAHSPSPSPTSPEATTHTKNQRTPQDTTTETTRGSDAVPCTDTESVQSNGTPQDAGTSTAPGSDTAQDSGTSTAPGSDTAQDSGTSTAPGSDTAQGTGTGTEAVQLPSTGQDSGMVESTGDREERQAHDEASTVASGDYIPGHGPKAHLTITIDYHALKAATANALGRTVFGHDLSAAAVRRLACDAQVIPVVLGSKSQPLDVGTTKRLITGPMRLALNARDHGCVVCGAPPIQCEAHHLIHWIDGGRTCVSNLVLLCKRHHIDLHAGHWTITITDGVVHVTRPTWATPDPPPPNTYKPTTYTEPTRAPKPPSTTQPWPHADLTANNATPDLIRNSIWGTNNPPPTPKPNQPQPPPPPTTPTANADSSSAADGRPDSSSDPESSSHSGPDARPDSGSDPGSNSRSRSDARLDPGSDPASGSDSYSRSDAHPASGSDPAFGFDTRFDPSSSSGSDPGCGSDCPPGAGAASQAAVRV